MRTMVLAMCLVLAASPVRAAGGFGEVHFANSGNAAAQTDFLDGLALLHDFEYPSAAAAFMRAQAADPDFAMAYWGEAMTYNHPIWMEQDLEAARAALNRLAPTAAARRPRVRTDREKAYFDAVEILYGEGTKEERDLRYERAMARLHERYPDDVDAAAFHGLSILGTAHAGRDIATYMRAAGVLEEAWMDHHEHPGLVHYLIHSYDDPAHAPLGLRAARIYARIAPNAAHAQHMTSHIFLALGMWQESVDANVAAIVAANAQRSAAGRDSLWCGHYPSWLAYSYLQLGRNEEAWSALSACAGAARSQAADTHAGHSIDPDASLSGSFANMRLRYLIDTGDWNNEATQTPLPTGAGPGARLDDAFARALREITLKHLGVARATLDDLELVANEVVDLETKRSDPDPTYRVRPKILVLEAKGLMAELGGDLPGAEKMLREAVGLEETLPIAFGPPTIDKPTHELMGEFFARHARLLDAQTEFRAALARTPGRRLSALGLKAIAQ